MLNVFVLITKLLYTACTQYFCAEHFVTKTQSLQQIVCSNNISDRCIVQGVEIALFFQWGVNSTDVAAMKNSSQYTSYVVIVRPMVSMIR